MVSSTKELLRQDIKEKSEVYRGMFPMRNTFCFENGVQITSDFDGGNLLKCVETDFEDII